MLFTAFTITGRGPEGGIGSPTLWVTWEQRDRNSPHRPSCDGSLAVSVVMSSDTCCLECFYVVCPEAKPFLLPSFRCDLMERQDPTQPVHITSGGISLNFSPFQIISLLLILWLLILGVFTLGILRLCFLLFVNEIKLKPAGPISTKLSERMQYGSGRNPLNLDADLDDECHPSEMHVGFRK